MDVALFGLPPLVSVYSITVTFVISLHREPVRATKIFHL